MVYFWQIMNSQKVIDKIITYSFYLLFFLVPLVMTPWNFELFEYNKMMLTYALTIIITASWIAKSILQKKFIFHKTPFAIPLSLFLLSQALSTIFSIDKHTSLFGYYSRFHGGLLSTISYFLLYFALVSNLDKKVVLNCLRFALYSAFLISVYAVLEHFGIDSQYWIQDVKNRVFSTLGQPNWLAAYLLALTPIPLSFVLNFKLKNVSYLFLSVIFITAIYFTRSRSGYIAAAAASVILISLLLLTKLLSLKQNLKLPVLTLLSLSLAVILVFSYNKFSFYKNDLLYIFGQKDTVEITRQQPYGVGSPSEDIRKVVWRGAFDIFRAHPVFGSGVETFAYSYYQYRPSYHNLLSEWDFLYNKAHNEYFNFLATTGALGLGSYLFLIGWVIAWHIRKILRDKDTKILSEKKLQTPNILISQYLLLSLFVGWLSILITNFFGFSVVIVALFFFLFPAIAYVLTREGKETESTFISNHQRLKKSVSLQTNFWQYLLLSAIILISSFLFLRLINFWQADTLYAQSIKANAEGEFLIAFNSLQEAILLNNEPVFFDELAWSAVNLAVISKNQKGDEKKTQELIKFSLDSINKALLISPRNLNLYRTKIKIYLRLAQIDYDYLKAVIPTLEKAVVLAPTEPKLLYTLALVYQNLGNREKAIESLEKTLLLKPNYVEPHKTLALLYSQQGKKKEALTIIDKLELIIPNQDKLKEEISL